MAHFKNKLSGKLRTALIAVLSVSVAVAAGWLGSTQLDSYENSMIEVFGQQQDQYVQLAADELKTVKSTDAKRFEDIIKSVSGSSIQYWTLSRGDELVFVKDIPETNRYRGITASTYFNTDNARSFIENLEADNVSHAVVCIDSRQYVASGTVVSVGDDAYRLCLLTGENVLMDNNAYLTARANLATIFGICAALFIAAGIGLSLFADRKTALSVATEKENAQLREQVEELSNRIAKEHTASAMTSVKPNERSVDMNFANPANAMRRIYQFKFYLNASHFVYFNGNKGEAHPHTWEFALKINVHDTDELVQFSTYEEALEKVFAPYQNKTINECEPFDALLPTLENLVEVFGARLLSVVDALDADLLQIEGSETPTRSYMVSYER